MVTGEGLTVISTALEILGLVAVIAGLFLLAGLALAIIAGGLGLIVLAQGVRR